jgi:HlyD family secretion protein
VRAALAQAQAAVRQAEAAVAQAGVERTQAEADLKRQQALQAKGFVSPQTVETAATRLNAAKAAVTTAEAAVGVARAQLKVQQVNLDYTEIRAPFDGVVLVKNANVGDIITPFSSAAGAQGAVVTMADMGTLEVEADVSREQPGQGQDRPAGGDHARRAARCCAFAAAWWASCPRWTAPRPR